MIVREQADEASAIIGAFDERALTLGVIAGTGEIAIEDPQIRPSWISIIPQTRADKRMRSSDTPLAARDKAALDPSRRTAAGGPVTACTFTRGSSGNIIIVNDRMHRLPLLGKIEYVANEVLFASTFPFLILSVPV